MKKILPWLFSGFMFCIALIYMPSLTSLFALITAVALLPIPPIQNFWAGLTSKKTGKSLNFAKPVIVVLSFLLAIMCTPKTENTVSAPDEIQVQNAVVAEIPNKQTDENTLKEEAKKAEEAARLEAEKKAQEQAAKEEAERKDAEEEAAKQAAEQKAAEEAAAKLEAEKKAAQEASNAEQSNKSTGNADTKQPSSSTTAPITSTYILNTNRKVFHESNCSSVSQMSEKNKAACDDRDYAISHGYKPCENCNP